MRRMTLLDWLGLTVLWTGAAGLLGGLMDELGVGEEGTILTVVGVWSLGVMAARVWWLRRGPREDTPADARAGLTTGEMTAQRLADMEARIYELEERLELTERLLAQASGRPRLSAAPEVTPV